MSTTNQLPDNFSGVIKENIVCTNLSDNTTRTIASNIKHYLNGKLHRTDGPAVEYADGSKEWWLDGKKNRLDGPAIDHANGRKEWWIAGQRLLEEQFDTFCRKIEIKEKKALHKKLKTKLPPKHITKRKKI